MNEYFPIVVQVIPQDDYTVYVYFDNGKIVLYDVNSKLDKEIFAPLKQIETFKSTCTIINNTLAWDLNGDRDATKCIDIDPFSLHELPSVKENIA